MYNEIAEDYNKFAWLGQGTVEQANNDRNRPVYILYETTMAEKFLRKDGIGNTAEPRETPIVETPPSPVSQEKNQPAVAMDTPTQDTKTSSRKSRKQKDISATHDTVYIERVRTDTVYLREDSPDFTSFEGFAYNNLVFLLDVSGSMNNPGKLPVMKKSISYLLTLLRPEDELSIVIFSGKSKVALRPTSAAEVEKIGAVIKDLQSEGKTNANNGLKLAYKVADDNYKRAGNNRIILATDGVLKISKSSWAMIKEFSGQDIHLSVMTFGGTERPVLKDMAIAGKGNYEHITEENASARMIMEAKAKRVR